MATFNKGCFFILICFISLACATSQGDKGRADKKVLLISIDGLRPDFYLDKAFTTPTLKKLANEGVHSKAMTAIFPTVTYPNHTTLVTGKSPKEHGILSNTKFNWKNGPTSEWYWYAKDIKVKTLWDILEEKGYKTAAFHWPVTIGAGISYLIPEVFPLKPWHEGKVWDLVEKHSTPGLKNEINSATRQQPYTDQKTADKWVSKAANYLIKKYSPTLTLVHLTMLDMVQHKHGRKSDSLNKELRALDANINVLTDGLDDTCVMVVGDHGFIDYGVIININTLFVKKGWITINKDGSLKDYQVIAHKSGAQAAIYLKDKSIEGKVVKLLKKNVAAGYHFVSGAELEKLGSYGDALAAVVAKPGFNFGNSFDKPFIEPGEKVSGQHGYLPSEAQMKTGFIANGCELENSENPLGGKNSAVFQAALDYLKP